MGGGCWPCPTEAGLVGWQQGIPLWASSAMATQFLNVHSSVSSHISHWNALKFMAQIRNLSLIKYFDCILAFLLVSLIFSDLWIIVNFPACWNSCINMVLRVAVIYKSTYLLEKNVPPFAHSAYLFAIMHQRSVISIILAKNSSLLLIVWNNLKACGAYSFVWFPAHSNCLKKHIYKRNA